MVEKANGNGFFISPMPKVFIDEIFNEMGMAMHDQFTILAFL
jgi:hypothetical protein